MIYSGLYTKYLSILQRIKNGFEVLTVLLLSRRLEYLVPNCIILYVGACCLNAVMVFINNDNVIEQLLYSTFWFKLHFI